MKSINNFITEAFREVQSQQVIDINKVDKKPQMLPSALPTMYQYLTAISDKYNGPVDYYADDETLDIYDYYFTKNKEYKFVVPNEDTVKSGIDFIVQTPNGEYTFKVLLTSDEVRYEDYACVIPYKINGNAKLLNNEKLDYLVWKVPNRNSFFLINRKEFLEYIGMINFGKEIKLQSVENQKDSTVIRISNSTLNRICNDTGDSVIIKLNTLSKNVHIGKDLEDYITKQKELLLKK